MRQSLLMWQTRERKQRVLSPLHSMFFLISVCIVLYRHKKSGHHLVTKAAKIIVLLYASMCKKVSINNGFHSSRLLIVKIQILFFIVSRAKPQVSQVQSTVGEANSARSSKNSRSWRLCRQPSGGRRDTAERAAIFYYDSGSSLKVSKK